MIEDGNSQDTRVLIVDDDAAHRMIARKALEQAGFAVEEAAGGEEGLRAIERDRPKLVLLDIMMPEINGYDVCGALRRNPQFVNLPVVMFTALDDVESIDRAFEAGATSLITKPFSWTLLAHHVNYALRVSQLEEELRKTKEMLESALKVQERQQ
jgi:PleD family two-component response regulator